MSNIDYFKSQAKCLLKDFKTRVYNDEKQIFEYKPETYNIVKIFEDFNIPHQKKDFTFSLMNAQHTIAKLSGASKWEDLLHASDIEGGINEALLRLSEYSLVNEERIKENKNKYIEKEEFLLPAPQNLYAWIIPQPGIGINVEFSFDSVEYAESYMIYYSEENNTDTAKPLAEGIFSPVKYTYRGNRQPAKYYWVRAFDGEEYGEWSEIADRNR